MGERIRSAGDDVRELRVQLSELQHRMSAAERDNATDDIRIQNLQEAISDLRPRGR